MVRFFVKQVSNFVLFELVLSLLEGEDVGDLLVDLL